MVRKMFLSVSCFFVLAFLQGNLHSGLAFGPPWECALRMVWWSCLTVFSCTPVQWTGSLQSVRTAMHIYQHASCVSAFITGSLSFSDWEHPVSRCLYVTTSQQKPLIQTRDLFSLDADVLHVCTKFLAREKIIMGAPDRKCSAACACHVWIPPETYIFPMLLDCIIPLK